MTTDTQDLANELEAESVGNRVSNHNARKAAALLRQQEDKLEALQAENSMLLQQKEVMRDKHLGNLMGLIKERDAALVQVEALQAEVERRGVVLLLAGLYPDCTKEDAKQRFADYESLQNERDAALARLAELEKRNQINQSARATVDNLLAQAGYADDSSARNLLGCMNFETAAGASPARKNQFMTPGCGAGGLGAKEGASPQPAKDHEIAALVNQLTNVAKEFHAHQSLRERVAQLVRPWAQPAGEVCVTTDPAGAIVAVTRQSASGRILEVIAEAAQPSQAGELSDTEALHFMEHDRGERVLSIGTGWYSRPSYGKPLKRVDSLRAAIRAAINAKGADHG